MGFNLMRFRLGYGVIGNSNKSLDRRAFFAIAQETEECRDKILEYDPALLLGWAVDLSDELYLGWGHGHRGRAAIVKHSNTRGSKGASGFAGAGAF
jgi:hypothetical protein